MQHFKDENNNVFVFEEGVSQDEFIKPNYTKITQEEADAIVNPPITIDEARKNKIASLSDAVSLKIVSGFKSDSLGFIHTYPSKEIDQINLAGLVAIGIDAPYVCEDDQGVWDKRPHTAGQLKKAAIDGAVWKSNLLDEFRARRDTVESTTTIKQIDAVSEVF